MKNRRTNRSINSRGSRKAKQICHNAVNVERLEDRTLLTTFLVSNVNDSNSGSLRQAILDANAHGGADVIQFAIGSGPVTISPATQLPTITDALTIDGTTQPGFTGTPLIQINGGIPQPPTNANAGPDGLTITAANTVVKSLALTRFHSAIVLAGSGHDVVQGCVIGLDPNATTPSRSKGISQYGIDISSPDNLIGGISPGQGNVIAVSGNSAIRVNTDGTTIQGNLLGTDAASHTGLGNGQESVEVDSGSGTLIGGGAGNVIASNTGDGILVRSAGSTTIQGNWIGTDATGAVDLGNSGNGIRVLTNTSGSNLLIDQNVLVSNNGDGIHLQSIGGATITGNLIGTDNAHTFDNLLANSGFGVSVLAASTGNVIGGNTSASRNVISGNDGAGVHIEDSSNTTVIGNYIGTTIDGGAALGNSTGVEVFGTSTGTVIGAPLHGNVISGNGGDGVYLQAPSTVKGNLIGTAANGTTGLGNGFEGVDIDSSNNIIGGTADHEGNTIAFNMDEGIQVYSGTGNALRGNSMHDNVALGIDLVEPDYPFVGPTPNGTSQAGANFLQHFPDFTAITGSGGNVSIHGTLEAPAGTYSVDLFASSLPHSTGYGEGEIYLGTVNVTTNGSGHGTFNAAYSGVAGSYITGTATDSNGNTSEFSPALGMQAAASVPADTSTTLTSSSNPSILGQNVTFTATVTSSPLAGTPNGHVTFKNGSTPLGNATLNASGVATLTTSILGLDDHSITAVYQQDITPTTTTFFNTSTSPVLHQQVNPVTTTTALTSSLNPSTYGQTVTITTTVTASSNGAGTPTGSITFTGVGDDPITVDLDINGVASLELSNLSVATYSITATYDADPFFVTSSATLSQVVNRASSTTTLASTVNPSTFGQSVTFTATVIPSVPGVATGTVTFTDGLSPLGTFTVQSDGTASVTLSTLSVATHHITATYSGDTTFTGSAATLDEMVQLAATSTAVSTSTNPSVLGQSVTITAIVTSAAGIPSGLVMFYDGATFLGQASVSSGTASFVVPTLAVGNHSIAVHYSGDTSFAASDGSTLQVVNPANTATTVTSSIDPSVFGQSVTFTASVSVLAPGAGTLAGTVTFFDGGTPIGSATLSGTTATLTLSNLATGHHSITAQYQASSDFNSSTSAALDQEVDAASTTTTLTSSTTPSPFGQTVTFTATVAALAPGAGTPDGTITFTDGATTLGTVSLVGGVATITSNTLTTGSHNITATYSGSNNFNTSTATIAQSITPLATATTVSSSVNPSVFGQSVTLTATVTGGTSINGTVTFFDGSTNLGTATLSSGGATLTISNFSVAHHSITAQYSDDTNFTASTSAPLDQVVTQAATTTAVTSSVNPSSYGNAVTFTATVSVNAPGAGAPSGTVTFMDGSTPLGTTTLSGGIVTFTTTATYSTGSHPITATYNGDTNFTASTGSLTQTVNALSTATTVSSSTNPSAFGQSVTVTATVTGANTGSGPITGTVSFLDGSTVIGIGTISSGVATLTISNFAVGHHNITARYEGNSNFALSTSAFLDQSVNAASTNTTLTSSANPSPFSTSVTFTATVAAIAPGAGTPTGTITFFDGATSIGTVTLSGGTATLSTAALSTGSHTITATYSSSSTSFTTSTSNPLTQTITALPTTNTLTGSPNPSAPGQSVTFTATVAGGNSTTGVPTGTVTFFDGSTALGTITLANGVATFSTTALSSGAHIITAVYNGAANFTTSTSNPVTQTVSASATGSVTGFVYNDANNNGLFDGGELPISGVTLTLTGTNDLSQSVTFTTSSDSTGAYRFDNLRPGTYKVTETQPANYGDGLDAKNNVVIAGSNTNDAISGITLLSGATAANNNFGELQLIINGAVLNDVTGNGLSNDDTALSGVLVNLYADTNHSGTLDTGDAIIDHVTTGGSGTYSFTKLPGRYFIQEVTPTGYLRTAPAVATFYNINAPIGGNSTGNDFDNFLADCDLSDVSNISYLINGTTIVTQLRGNIHQGDVVEAIFTIAPGQPHRYSLVSYTAPSAVFDASVASQQMVYDTDSQVFNPGVHTLTVTVPDCFFQIDFVCGSVIDRLGPVGSNIFYTPQGRLIDADNNGTQACINGPGSISGFTYVDINNNGLIDLNDGIISGVKVTLTGTNDQGASVSMVEFSDDDGQYFFGGLRPGTYTITETQPTGIADGKDTLGTIAGAPTANFGTVGADKFTNIKISTNQDAVNYNFGENDCVVQCGQAATIGFWQNSNGQTLIKSLNGGSSATNLGIWLANTYPNLYGSAAGVANLLGKTNAQIASFYTTLFKTTGQKLDAQVMSVALAIYVTDSGHAGTAGTNYGFTVNDTGLAVATFSVGSNGAAFGVANNTTLTVGSLLDIANNKSWAGVLWDVDHTGVINSTEQAWRNMANTIFSAINTTGDIT